MHGKVMGRWIRWWVAFFMAGAVICDVATAKAPLSVFVSIVPQAYFVQRIGGDRVKVEVMVSPGASPHQYEPRPRQVAAISEADVYFAVGVAFESVWLKRFMGANPRLKVIHTDRGITKRPMVHPFHPEAVVNEKDKAEKGRDPDHDHRPEGRIMDPHIWTAPRLVMVQALAIRDTLCDLDPGHRSLYEANFALFSKEVSALDEELRHLFEGRKGMRFMVFHPSWGYFADAYGLEQVPMEMEGKEPKPAQLQEIITLARDRGIRVVFVQPQFSTRSAGQIAREIGAEVVHVDPLAVDWMENLRQVARAFQAALR